MTDGGAGQAGAAPGERPSHLALLFRHSAVGQAVVAADSRFVAVNPAFCELVGYEEEELIGQRTAMVVDPVTLAQARKRFVDALDAGAERVDAVSQWRTRDGRVIDVSITIIPERDDDGRIRHFISAATDITELRRARQGLERLAAIVETSEDAIETLSLDGTVTSWNAAAERIYGYSAGEMLGSTLGAIVPADRHGEVLSLLEQAKSGRSVAGHETKRIRKDGSLIDVSLSVSPLRSETGEVVGLSVIARDVTDAKRAQDALRAIDEQRRSLLERVVSSRHEERLRMARELHDGLGQILTSAALIAKSLQQSAPSEQVETVASLRTVLDEALATTRTLVWRLRPHEVEERGFALAIRTLAEQFRRRHGVHVEVQLVSVDDLASPVEAAAYRVIQEAMTNSVQHGSPTTLSIVAVRSGPTVTVVVEDDGCGFDPAAIKVGHDRGAGILGMRERAEALGGELVVESEPGRGTTVRLVVSSTAGQ